MTSPPDAPLTPRSERELVTSRVLPTPPERVFDAFRDPEKLIRWWGPRGFTSTFHAFDFRPGGTWSLTLHGPDGTDYPGNDLTFLEIEEPHRLVLQHTDHYRAEFLLKPIPEGTRVVFYQAFETAEICRQLAEIVGPANDQNLERLAAVVG